MENIFDIIPIKYWQYSFFFFFCGFNILKDKLYTLITRLPKHTRATCLLINQPARHYVLIYYDDKRGTHNFLDRYEIIF